MENYFLGERGSGSITVGLRGEIVSLLGDLRSL